MMLSPRNKNKDSSINLKNNQVYEFPFNLKNEKILEIIKNFFNDLEKKIYVYKNQVYKNSFITEEAINWVIKNNIIDIDCNLKLEAIKLLNLFIDLEIIIPVEDSEFDFFKKECIFIIKNFEEEEILKIYKKYHKILDTINNTEKLTNLLLDFTNENTGVCIKDRFYKLKKYKNCFIGSEAKNFN
jgi:hypothetical protein